MNMQLQNPAICSGWTKATTPKRPFGINSAGASPRPAKSSTNPGSKRFRGKDEFSYSPNDPEHSLRARMALLAELLGLARLGLRQNSFDIYLHFSAHHQVRNRR